MTMRGENEAPVNLDRSTAPKMTRRQALLDILRVGGVAAGAAGAAFWLSERSRRPVPGAPNKRAAITA